MEVDVSPSASHDHGHMRHDLPSGTVTFLFTDVEGSTKLLHELGARAYAETLAEHRRVVREACTARGGVEVDTQGDAFFVAFATAPGALEAARAITEELASGPITLRIGLHTGTPLLTEEGYVGEDVHFAARVAASAHGGQVVLSQGTRVLFDEGYAIVELGEHRLKDIPAPVAIYQLGDGRFPPLKTISNTNLPRPASSFVGRERELSELLARIEDGARLLTLTGPGGSGKTRLALEAAATLVSEYKAGVFWVGLASLRDPVLVTDMIAQTLGAKDSLAEHIGERELLLLLDNLEQVIEAAPELSSLLQRCSNLTLLVTSRELLRVQGEVEYPVPPLAEVEAVSLFSERAQTTESDYIAELCRRLDNLPLAVELAAARTKALSPAQLLERLSQRLDLLKGGRDADPRQQTLRATIEWSHDLLTEEEQQLFRRLSVFAGGCTLKAAAEVCDADLDPLQSLVEKSLLRFSNGRYWMLETIREYASERLQESGGAHEVRRRFVDSLLALAREVEFGSRQREWLERVQAEHENVRAALDVAPSPEIGLLLAADLVEFWFCKGHVREGRSYLETLLERHRASDAIRARGALVAGELASHQDDYVMAGAFFDEAERLLAAVGGKSERARLSLARGWMAWLTGDLDASVAFLEEGLDAAEAASRRELHARALRMLAVVERGRGNEAAATELEERSLALFRGLGEDLGIGLVLADMAWRAACGGDYERARRLGTESLVHFGHSLHPSGDPSVQHTIALALFGLEQPTEALDIARIALLGAWERHDVIAASALVDLVAAVAAESGDDVRAARLAGAANGLLERAGAASMELEAARAVYDHSLESARERAGSAPWDAERAAGAALDFNEAVEYALATNAG